MKVYICPICGEKIPSIAVEYLENGDNLYCKNCEHWILPLATPQKERGNNGKK